MVEDKTEEEKKAEEEAKKKAEAEKDPTFLEKVTAVKDSIAEENSRMEKNLAELKEIKATEMLSGKIDASKDGDKKEPETNLEFAERKLAGG